jgi:hypothetical protein
MAKQIKKNPIKTKANPSTGFKAWVTAHTPGVAVAGLILSLAALCVSIGNLVYQRRYTQLTEEMVEASSRPYVGIENAVASITPALKQLAFKIDMRNNGNVPAYDVHLSWNILVNHVPEPMIVEPDTPTVINPQTTVSQAGSIIEPEYSRVMSGAAQLEVTIQVTYKGRGDRVYHFDVNMLYNPSNNMFLNREGHSD